VEELVDEFTRGGTNGFMSCMVAILYFASVYGLERLGISTWFKPGIRGFIADYAYPVSCLVKTHQFAYTNRSGRL